MGTKASNPQRTHNNSNEQIVDEKKTKTIEKFTGEWTIRANAFLEEKSALNNTDAEIIEVPIIAISQHKLKLFIKAKIPYSHSYNYGLDKMVYTLIDVINKKANPIKIKVIYIDCTKSFVRQGGYDGNQFYDGKNLDIDAIQFMKNKNITYWGKNSIINKGLTLIMRILPRNVQITNCHITCPYLIKANKNNDSNHNISNCPIYLKMKYQYEFNKEHLNHFENYSHFKNIFEDKAECKHNQSCKKYLRIQSNEDRIDDKCHMLLYRHPPRQRSVLLQSNWGKFTLHGFHKFNDISPLHDQWDIAQHMNFNNFAHFDYFNTSDYINELIAEVKKHGYEDDLTANNGVSIMVIVNEKLMCKRHQLLGFPLNKGEMLAVILYTGSECNYDLCKTQRNYSAKTKEVNKWMYLDNCLYRAIEKLSNVEKINFNTYSGLNKVRMKNQKLSGFLSTYISSSWNEQVALSFIDEGEGMLIEIDKKFFAKRIACDVSWISKFPDECEILIGRSYHSHEQFEAKIIDQDAMIQRVLVKPVKTVSQELF